MTQNFHLKITKIQEFADLLTTNEGLIIIKFGAEWCGPCKRIEKLVNDCYLRMPTNVKTYVVDIDESFELYGFLKSKKRINGIPTIFCYKKGNNNYIPDDTVVGADEIQINLFFQRCIKML